MIRLKIKADFSTKEWTLQRSEDGFSWHEVGRGEKEDMAFLYTLELERLGRLPKGTRVSA